MPSTNPVAPASGATYDRIAPATGVDEPQNEGDGSVVIDITGDPPGDAYESTDLPSTLGYGPRGFDDRFRFDVQNGMLDASKRFSATRSRLRGLAAEGYDERRSVGVQVTRTAGSGSTYAALFTLQYGDADPSSGRAGSHAEARAQYNRMTDQNLELLNEL